MLGIEDALREIVRDEVRKELRHHREEMLVAVRSHDRPPPKTGADPDELLTVDQVARGKPATEETAGFAGKPAAHSA